MFNKLLPESPISDIAENTSQKSSTKPTSSLTYIKGRFLFKIIGVILIYFLIFIAGCLIGLKREVVNYNKQNAVTISLLGEGIIKTPADKAHIQVDIVDYDTDYDQVYAQNQKRVSAFIDSLYKIGIPKTDITKNFNGTVPDGTTGTYLSKQKDLFYHAHGLVDVDLSDVEKYKQLATVTDTLNEHFNGNKVDYGLKTPDLSLNLAKQRALENATEQIEDITKINHLKFTLETPQTSKSSATTIQKPVPYEVNSNFIVKDSEIIKFTLQP